MGVVGARIENDDSRKNRRKRLEKEGMGRKKKIAGNERWLEGEGIGRKVIGVDCRGWKVVGGRRY